MTYRDKAFAKLDFQPPKIKKLIHFLASFGFELLWLPNVNAQQTKPQMFYIIVGTMPLQPTLRSANLTNHLRRIAGTGK